MQNLNLKDLLQNKINFAIWFVVLCALSGCAMDNLDEQQSMFHKNLLKNYHFKQMPETLTAPAYYTACDKNQDALCGYVTPIYKPIIHNIGTDTQKNLSHKHSIIKRHKSHKKISTKIKSSKQRDCTCAH